MKLDYLYLLLLIEMGQSTVYQNLSGNVSINQMDYKVFCECGGEAQVKKSIEQHSQCQIKDMRIVLSRQGQGHTPDVINDLLDQPKNQVSKDIKTQPFYCMDGRNQEKQLYTPGGDFSEFLLALHVYESFTSPLSPEQIKEILETYLSKMSQTVFYYCTDDQALQHIEKELQKSFNSDNLITPFIQDEKELLSLLKKSENQGDSHLKLMMQYSQYYSIRLELITSYIQAFFEIFWNKDNPNSQRIKVESLIGKHNEKAFVEVRKDICKYESVILFSQKKRNDVDQILVNHIDAVQVRRLDLANFFIKQIADKKQIIDANTMLNRMNRHALAFLEITGSFIAKDIPFYTVTLS